MAFKIRNFYGSPLHSEGFTMDELNKKTKKEQVKSKAQASKLPQIEKPGFDYEMDQDMSYPGGERGRDYDEEGTKKSMSRKASPLNKKNPHPVGTGAHKNWEKLQVKKLKEQTAMFDKQANETPETATRDRSKKGWPKKEPKKNKS